MGSRRPNRYAGSRTYRLVTVTRLKRADLERQKRIRELDRQLSEFSKKPLDLLKIKHIFKMYDELTPHDKLGAEWYVKFENLIPEMMRPSVVYARITNDDKLAVRQEASLSLRSLIVAFGPNCAHLVKYAVAHNLTDKEKFFVMHNETTDDTPTCSVASIAHGWEWSLGRVPTFAVAAAVALEHNVVQLAEIEGVRIDDFNKMDAIKYALYMYPEITKKE